MKKTAIHGRLAIKGESNFDVNLVTLVEKELTLTDKKSGRYIIFKFQDGEMVKVLSSLPYNKSSNDWHFFGTAIMTMLAISQKYFKEPKRVKRLMDGVKEPF
jgi:hypothetical protein